jgi:hypothetical protein
MIGKEIVLELPRRLLVPWYLIASYAYYHLDESFMDDSAYDALCVRLNREWVLVQHRHKAIISRAALTATTAYNIRRKDYPTIVQVAAAKMLADEASGDLVSSLQPILKSSSMPAPVQRRTRPVTPTQVVEPPSIAPVLVRRRRVL